MASRSPVDADRLHILIVDDHALFRGGLRQLIEQEDDMRVVGEASNGEEAITFIRERAGRERAGGEWAGRERAGRETPASLDLVLMDIDLPGMDGIGATRRIRAEFPDLPVIMLTVSTLDRDLIEAVEAGAVGFLTKSLSASALIRALRDFRAEGALPMDPTMAARVVAHFQRRIAAPGSQPAPAADTREWLEERLTPREQQVLAQLTSGARDREIADRLVIAERTVKNHVQSILRKLGARNRTEAVARFHNSARIDEIPVGGQKD
jgi:DNA-binding NarL/FixJ family response regulator